MSKGPIAAIDQARMFDPILEAAEAAGLSLDWVAKSVAVYIDPDRRGPWMVGWPSGDLDSAQCRAAHDAAVCLLVMDDALDWPEWKAAAAYLSDAYAHAVSANAYRKAVERSKTASENARAERRPEINKIIARIAKHEGGAKELWGRFLGELDSKLLDPKEGVSPKGDRQVHYDAEAGDRRLSMTRRQLQNRLTQARKTKR